MKMPKQILVWVCDETPDGVPIFAVDTKVDDIDAGYSGETVGVYRLDQTAKLKVSYELDRRGRRG